MFYKSIFNAVSTNNFFKGGDVNRNTFFKNAVMLCVLFLVSIGCADSSAQSTNQDGARLVGTWVDNDGDKWTFKPDGTVDGGKYVAIDGKLVNTNAGKGNNKSYYYDYVISKDGKTLLLGCISMGGDIGGCYSYILRKEQ